ncbi:hypothetical protein [Bradyrhizobium algeriense]|uniref:hypothetical protein n=1 Tax=Bradyrhizobium algeriense TaxID=634784 RepID=UPI001FCE3345|nr:hypothetical protein [Bradyrhizobium algeriense]
MKRFGHSYPAVVFKVRRFGVASDTNGNIGCRLRPRAFFGFALFTGRSLGASFDDGWCETAALPWALRRSRLDVVAFELAAAAPPSFALELKITYI